MLESIDPRRGQERLHRYASLPPEDLDFLQRQGLDAKGIDEVLSILQPHRRADRLEGLLDAPFHRKGRGRYSNGDFPVFYSALEQETAGIEVEYWYGRRAFGDGTRARTAYYDHLQCDFDGLAKDLRGKQEGWPLLVHPDTERSYLFCNRLGAEAVAEGLDGLYAPSARRQGGTCMPVFRRGALSKPSVSGSAALSFDPSSGEVSVNLSSAGTPPESM
jgi:RES domain